MELGHDRRDRQGGRASPLTCISAITLIADDMSASVRFYSALGFELTYGDEGATFVSLRCGDSYLNLIERAGDKQAGWWGRVIFHVSDVDAMFERVESNGFAAETQPRDADWGERYFHMRDPAGHELSFAKPLGPPD